MNRPTKKGVTPFHTLDPMLGEGFDEFVDVLESQSSDEFEQFMKKYPQIAVKLENEGADLAIDFSNPQWDSATILFVAYRAIQDDGAPAEPLDRGISMERIGRFPSRDGNAISYLRQFHIAPDDDETMSVLLEQLDVGLRSETRGHVRLSQGFGGLNLHGWLTSKEVGELRLVLQKSAWAVSKDETFDGGVRDIVRHLLILLKSAEKRNLGVLMRSHQ